MTDAEQVRSTYEAEYVQFGYIYSGEMSPEFAGRQSGLGFDRTLDAITQLVEAGILRRRDCDAWTYELMPAERVRLIKAHRLRAVWEDKAPYFYPNHPQYGEIPAVLREAGGEPAYPLAS